jgi:hypothetical protein
MNRIEIDVITDNLQIIELTAEEVTKAQASYAEWLAAQPNKEKQIAEEEKNPVVIEEIKKWYKNISENFFCFLFFNKW